MKKVLLEIDEEGVYKKVEEELGKTKKDVEECSNILEEWFKTQPHLPEIPNKEVIRSFLFFNKFSIEKCKQKIDMYYSLRNVLPEMFNKHPCSPEMIEISKVAICVPLPKLGDDKRRIIFVILSDKYGPESFYHDRYVCNMFNVMELLIREDIFLGSHFIIDCSNFKAAHIPKISPMYIKNAAILMEKVFSNRVASIHLVNYHPILETTMNLARPLLPAKIASRLFIHKNADILFTLFPKSTLPKDIGGEGLTLDELNDLLLEKFKQYKDVFDKLTTMKVNESLRPEKLINDDILGYYGNFKKLDVD